MESKAISQILQLLNQQFASESKIRIMPDTHAGADCTIGTTMALHGTVVPHMVGVDIGCGMEVIQLNAHIIDFEKFDSVVRRNISSGFAVHSNPLKKSQYGLDNLRCINHIDMTRALHSIGTFGGGNHFIEVDKDEDGSHFLVIHSGNRYLGKQIANYYQSLAENQCKKDNSGVQSIICELKAQGREKEPFLRKKGKYC